MIEDTEKEQSESKNQESHDQNNNELEMKTVSVDTDCSYNASRNSKLYELNEEDGEISDSGESANHSAGLGSSQTLSTTTKENINNNVPISSPLSSPDLGINPNNISNNNLNNSENNINANVDYENKRMNNYFSVGMDAELALSFHAARELHPERFNSRLYNKSVYLRSALKKFASFDIPDISGRITLKVMDPKNSQMKPVKIPKGINALIFQNIPSYSGGRRIWSASGNKWGKCDMSDGKLEVIGVSIADMAKIFTGLGVGKRIAQTESAILELKEEMATQIDGEPWMQIPSKIKIQALNTPQKVLVRGWVGKKHRKTLIFWSKF